MFHEIPGNWFYNADKEGFYVKNEKGGKFLHRKVIPSCFSKAWNKEKISSRSVYLLFCLTLPFWIHLTTWILKLNLCAHGYSFEASPHGLRFWPFIAYVQELVERNELNWNPFYASRIKQVQACICFDFILGLKWTTDVSRAYSFLKAAKYVQSRHIIKRRFQKISHVFSVGA